MRACVQFFDKSFIFDESFTTTHYCPSLCACECPVFRQIVHSLQTVHYNSLLSVSLCVRACVCAVGTTPHCCKYICVCVRPVGTTTHCCPSLCACVRASSRHYNSLLSVSLCVRVSSSSTNHSFSTNRTFSTNRSPQLTAVRLSVRACMCVRSRHYNSPLSVSLCVCVRVSSRHYNSLLSVSLCVLVSNFSTNRSLSTNRSFPTNRSLQLTAVRLSVRACVCPVFTMHNDSICELTLDRHRRAEVTSCCSRQHLSLPAVSTHR